MFDSLAFKALQLDNLVCIAEQEWLAKPWDLSSYCAFKVCIFNDHLVYLYLICFKSRKLWNPLSQLFLKDKSVYRYLNCAIWLIWFLSTKHRREELPPFSANYLLDYFEICSFHSMLQHFIKMTEFLPLKIGQFDIIYLNPYKAL